MSEVLCALHGPGEPEHWVPVAEAVGVVHLPCCTLADAGVTAAALECAEATVDPSRIVDWQPGNARWVA